MRRLGLFMAALMAGTGVLEAEAQISFEYAKNYFDNQEIINDLKRGMGDRLNDLDANIRKYIDELDFSGAKATELLAGLEKPDWEILQPRILTGMSAGELQKLAQEGGFEIPERFLNEVKRVLIMNMTDSEVATTIKSKLPELVPGEMGALLKRLGPLKSWTRDNITAFGPTALQLRVCLDNADDKEVLQDVLKLANDCGTSNPPTGCPKKSDAIKIQGQVTMKLLGASNKWRFSDMEDVVIPDIPSAMIHDVSDSFISDIKADLIQQDDLLLGKNQMKAEAWVAAMCRVEDCSTMTGSRAKTWYDNLSKMRTAITPSDLPPEAMKDTSLAVQLEENAIKKNPIRASDAAILLDMKLGKDTPDTTKEIGGKLVGWAPACYLADAADKKELATVRNELAPVLDLVRGPEYMAKVRAAMKTEMEAAYSNDVFGISRVNDNLKPFLNPKLLSDQSSSTLLNLAKKAHEKYINLSPHQMEVIASKINAGDSQQCPDSLCQRLPISFMANFRKGVLADIDRNLAGVTLPCLLGAKTAFTDKTSLTPAMIEEGKAFLKCMSYEDASKIKADDIFEIFDKFKTEDFSWSLCRASKMKLVEWKEKKFNDTNQDDLTNLFVNEIYKIPACVAIMFEPGIYDMNMNMKKAFLNNLCQAKNYMTIPKDARSEMVNSLLGQIMEEGPMTVCNLEMIGSCSLDLEPSLLRRLDKAAMNNYVNFLEKSLKEGAVDCFDSGRMDEVADMLTQLKGPAGTWKTADDVSCILETFTSGAIDSIVNNLPADVLINTGCPMRTDDFRPISKSCMDSRKAAMMRMKETKVKECVKRREKFGTKDSSCDALRCGNVLYMTESQLERMTKEDVMKYLDDLATEDLNAGEAQVVLTKMKENKGLEDMSAEELERIKHVWRGLTKRDVSNIPTLNPSEHDGVVQQLGMATGLDSVLSDDVIMALRDKILRDFRAPSSMKPMDVFLYGNLLCHLTNDQINAIPKDTIKKSMRNLGNLNCDSNTTYYLAEAAKAAYNKEMKDWDASMVHEMNVLVAGLTPEDLLGLPGHACIGITDRGMQKIEPNTLKVMTVKQAHNLDGRTAAAVTSAQASSLNSEVRNALNSAKSENLRAGASGLSVPRVLGAVAAAVLLLLL